VEPRAIWRGPISRRGGRAVLLEVRAPEQPGKGKDGGDRWRIQLNWVGVSRDKAKVLYEPGGFLVLLNFKGLLR